MKRGAVTISIDLELAWGNWDNITDEKLALVESLERPIVARLVEIFDHHEVPVTWAIVAALLDPKSAGGRPGKESSWYAPDVIDGIRGARVRHDIGSHSGRHLYYDRIPVTEVEDDLAFARSVHAQHGLRFQSFVFARNRVAKTELLKAQGVRVFRGQDPAWHQRIRNLNNAAGRIANLADQALPIAPPAVQPVAMDGVVNLPGSMLFASKNKLRGLVAPSATRAKLARGLSAARRQHGVFHLWFHPSNFYYRQQSQFALFERFIAQVAEEARDGLIDVEPMASFAAA